jgi:hypothetical protein
MSNDVYISVDILSRQDYSYGRTCQGFQSRPGLCGLRGHFGSISSDYIKNN